MKLVKPPSTMPDSGKDPNGLLLSKEMQPISKAADCLTVLDSGPRRLLKTWARNLGKPHFHRYLCPTYKTSVWILRWIEKDWKNTRSRGTRNDAQIIQSKSTVTYTPGHKIGKSPIILFMEEQMTNTTTEWLLVISVIDYLQHCLCVTRPRPV